jgi:hypothetical protein
MFYSFSCLLVCYLHDKVIICPESLYLSLRPSGWLFLGCNCICFFKAEWLVVFRVYSNQIQTNIAGTIFVFIFFFSNSDWI